MTEVPCGTSPPGGTPDWLYLELGAAGRSQNGDALRRLGWRVLDVDVRLHGAADDLLRDDTMGRFTRILESRADGHLAWTLEHPQISRRDWTLAWS